MNNFLITANWKLNGSIKMISSFFENLQNKLSIYLEKNTVVIAPPTIFLETVYKHTKNMNIFLGAQNTDVHLTGAFTGETSILMLQEMGVKYVIIGHSERRLLHNETNKTIVKKLDLIKRFNLIPILCIGETGIDKKNGCTKEVIKNQLYSIFKCLGKLALRNTVIAYEPIWAIGTGLSADPQYVQSIHQFIKSYIQEYDSVTANNIIIQYGGSIKSNNAKNYIEQPDINGLLIGNASLDAKELLKIIKIVYNLKK